MALAFGVASGAGPEAGLYGAIGRTIRRPLGADIF